jgi:hypothetical protein
MIVALLAVVAGFVPPPQVLAVEVPPAPRLSVAEARRAIGPHVSRIESCVKVRRAEVTCVVVRSDRRVDAHARRLGKNLVRVTFTAPAS